MPFWIFQINRSIGSLHKPYVARSYLRYSSHRGKPKLPVLRSQSVFMRALALKIPSSPDWLFTFSQKKLQLRLVYFLCLCLKLLALTFQTFLCMIKLSVMDNVYGIFAFFRKLIHNWKESLRLDGLWSSTWFISYPHLLQAHLKIDRSGYRYFSDTKVNLICCWQPKEKLWHSRFL